MSKRNFNISKMYCTQCGNEGVSIWRKSNKKRECGHLKKLYCIHCKKETNHVEVRSMFSDYNYEDFQLEIKYNNFNIEGNRKEPYRIFRGNLKQKGFI